MGIGVLVVGDDSSPSINDGMEIKDEIKVIATAAVNPV